MSPFRRRLADRVAELAVEEDERQLARAHDVGQERLRHPARLDPLPLLGAPKAKRAAGDRRLDDRVLPGNLGSPRRRDRAHSRLPPARVGRPSRCSSGSCPRGSTSGPAHNQAARGIPRDARSSPTPSGSGRRRRRTSRHRCRSDLMLAARQHYSAPGIRVEFRQLFAGRQGHTHIWRARKPWIPRRDGGLERASGLGSGQADHHHVISAWGCFLPDLTWFTSVHRAGPGHRRLHPAH